MNSIRMSSRSGEINYLVFDSDDDIWLKNSLIIDSDDEENLINYLVNESISNDTVEIDDEEDQGILNEKVIFTIFKF